MATEWYYLKNGEKVGPISSTELKNLAVKQEIMPSDLIWKEGLEKWVAAKSVKRLFEVVEGVKASSNQIKDANILTDKSSVKNIKLTDPVSNIQVSEKKSPPPIIIKSNDNTHSEDTVEDAVELDLITYCWRYYTDSHTISPKLCGFFVGIISLPALSFLKPRIGTENIWFIALGLFSAGGLLLVLQMITSLIKFVILKQRSLPDYHLRWGSSLTSFLLTLSVMIGIGATLESFGPSQGLIAKIIPQLGVEQNRLFAKLDTSDPDLELESDSNVKNDRIDIDAKSKKSPVLKEKSQPLVKADETEEKPILKEKSQPLVKADETDINNKAESVKAKVSMKNASGIGKDLEDNPETPDRKVTKSVRNPVAKSDQDSENEKTASQNSGTQSVVAEGLGASPDEAIKDAYRNAVRQVVGAVVDAETLVNDDEVIDDKVLTYSDGFIKTYEEVVGSKSVKSGIHRIKIKAVVERRSVVAELKAANITMKEVDGKGMFAEIVSKQSGEANATELIKKSLADLPKLLTAKISGEPNYDRTTSELVVMVEVTPDEIAYKVFAKRLEETLTKVAISKDSVVLKAVNQKTRNSMGRLVDGPDEFLIVRDASSLNGPKSPNTNPGDQVWGLWVCSFTSGKHKTQTWNGYVLPGDFKKCFIPLLMPEIDPHDPDVRSQESTSDNVTAKPSIRANNSKTNLRLVFLDKEGETVTQDLRELTVYGYYPDNKTPYNSNNRIPLMRTGVFQNIGPKEGFISTRGLSKYLESNNVSSRFNGLIAPFFFQPSPELFLQPSQGGNSILLCSTKRMVEFRIKVTEEELPRFHRANVEISYSE
jgi:hypothetical protein